MIITLPAIAIPAILSAIVVVVFFVWPVKGPSGSYDFGPQIVSLALLVCSVIALLAIWLVYFIIV
jgi:hypothetical protein